MGQRGHLYSIYVTLYLYIRHAIFIYTSCYIYIYVTLYLYIRHAIFIYTSRYIYIYVTLYLYIRHAIFIYTSRYIYDESLLPPSQFHKISCPSSQKNTSDLPLNPLPKKIALSNYQFLKKQQLIKI